MSLDVCIDTPSPILQTLHNLAKNKTRTLFGMVSRRPWFDIFSSLCVLLLLLHWCYYSDFKHLFEFAFQLFPLLIYMKALYIFGVLMVLLGCPMTNHKTTNDFIRPVSEVMFCYSLEAIL